MDNGDPYIRALMRTITASEANVSRPYHVIYGGRYVEELDEHPQTWRDDRSWSEPGQLYHCCGTLSNA